MADEPAAPTAAAAVSGAPSSWPGAFGAYKYSKAAVMTNIGTLIIIWLAVAIIDGIGQKSLGNASGLVSLLIAGLATAAYVLTFMAGVRGQKLSIGDALSKALPLWLKMTGLLIVVGISLMVSFLLLVIPFLFVWPRLSLATYFLVDKNMGVMEAYKASWAATKGSVGKVWGIFGATLLMVLLMVTIIGIPFSIYFLIMYSGAYAILYEFLNKSKPAVAAPAPAAPAPQAPAAA
jgi:uncharacterized membrane protein